MKIRDFLERLFWTAVVASGANITTAVVFDIAWWEMAAATAVAAVLQAVVTFGRYRLRRLPDPGDGLPGLPTHDGGG